MTAAAGAPESGRKAEGSHGRGRHAPVTRRRRWPWVVVAVAAIMAVVATVGIVLFRDEAEAIVADGCTGSAALKISAAPAIASSLKGVADDFDSWVEDRAGVPCTTTEITAASPQEVAESVGQALDGNAENAPTTWVAPSRSDAARPAARCSSGGCRSPDDRPTRVFRP